MAKKWTKKILALDEPVRYEIRVSGYLGSDWLDLYDIDVCRTEADSPLSVYYEESWVRDQESSRTWARLIAQVYEVDPLECPRCHAPMNVIAVITEPEEVRKILRHLVKIGRSPPGLDSNFV